MREEREGMVEPQFCNVEIADDGTINYETMFEPDESTPTFFDVIIEWYIGGQLAVRTEILTGLQRSSIVQLPDPGFRPVDVYNFKTEQDVIDQLGYGEHEVTVEVEEV